MSVHRLLSACTIGTVGLACKAFLNLGFCKSVTINGLHHLLKALDDEERNNGRGIVTVANHISTLDDPLTWGVLPARCFLNLRDMRWALGASDIMFTNSIFSAFFRKGQVIETFRGNGVYQPAVDAVIEKLNKGAWVHLFGEGKVNQPYQYQLLRTSKERGGESTGEGDNVARLPRFKWGTGRILMETQRLPVVIPMWISGFEDVMPEPRPPGFPEKFLPRTRQSIQVTFAPPLDNTRLVEILETAQESDRASSLKHLVNAHDLKFDKVQDTSENRRIREAITTVVQQAVEDLGYIMSGPLLGRPSKAVQGPKPFTPR